MLALSEIKIASGSCHLPPCADCAAAPQSLSSHLILRVTFMQMEGALFQVARLPLFVPGQAVSRGAGF